MKYFINANLIWYSKTCNAYEDYTMQTIFNELILDFNCAEVTTTAAFMPSSSNNEMF